MGVDREKVIKGLECCTMLATLEHPYRCKECPYQINGAPCERFAIMNDALALLKEQETTSTGKTRIFQCEKCGYGIDDIYLSNEHDFDVYPHFCPNCGRPVKW